MNEASRERANDRSIERLRARVSTACHGVYTHFLRLFSCTRACMWPAGSVAAAVSSLLPLARSHHSTGLYTTVVVVVVDDSHDDCLQHMFTIKRRERKTGRRVQVYFCQKESNAHMRTGKHFHSILSFVAFFLPGQLAFALCCYFFYSLAIALVGWHVVVELGLTSDNLIASARKKERWHLAGAKVNSSQMEALLVYFDHRGRKRQRERKIDRLLSAHQLHPGRRRIYQTGGVGQGHRRWLRHDRLYTHVTADA